MKRINQSAYRRSKWAVLTLLLFCRPGYANKPAQDSVLITISVSNTPIEQVFRSIEQQTNYTVLYNTRIVNPAEKVSVNVRRATLERTMAEILRGKDLMWSIKGSGILIIPRREQNGGTVEDSVTRSIISGVVRQEDTNVPLAGVSVLNKNTGKGAITDASGIFKLIAGRGDMLQLSSVGQSAKLVRVSDVNGDLVVKMVREVQVAKEVEVLSTGYQNLSPERTTGSFSYVGRELLDRKVSTDILSRLDGVVPGILFDKRNPVVLSPLQNVQVRGLYSLRTVSPLIILDKFPFDGNINDINPNDIESITILKDAGAASIWGARAGNGVIVITTKKGKNNEPMQLSINANTTIQNKPDLFKIPQMSVSDYIDLEKYLFNQGKYNGDINSPSFIALSPVINILVRQRKGEITEQVANEQIEALKRYDARNDFSKYIYQTGITQQYAANISGGARNIKYYVSAGLDKGRSLLVGNSSERISLRSTTSFQATSKLQFDLGLAYTNGTSVNNSLGEYGSGPYKRGTKVMLPYSRLADDNGNPLPIENLYRSSFTDTVGRGKLLDWSFTPLEDLRNRDLKTKSQSLIIDLSSRYNLLPTLSIDVSYRYQKDISNNRNWNKLNTFSTNNLINRFTVINGNNINYVVPLGDILDISDAESDMHNLRGGLSFNKSWQGIHNLSAIAGAELRDIQANSNSYRLYGYNDHLGYSNVDYVNQYVTYFGFYEQIPSNLTLTGTTNRFTSIYANASYTYNNRYTLTGSARRDASNFFGVKTNSRGRPFWSAGAAWNITNESFYTINNILPQFKLRFTYGYNGNTQPFPAVAIIGYLPGSNQAASTNLPYASLTNPANPTLKWEKVNVINMGLDYGFKNNIIRGSLEYYRKKSIDLIASEVTDPTTGLNSISTNSATMKGDGIDLQITSTNINKNNISWNTTFNFSYVNYKVLEYFGQSSINQGLISDGASINALQGYNPFIVISYKWAGLDQNGQPQGYVNGKVSKNYDSIINYTPLKDQTVSGPALAPFYGNIMNNFRWQRFSLSTNITYRLKYYYRRPPINYADIINGLSMHGDYANRWKKPGDELITSIPAFAYPASTSRELFYAYSDVNVRRGDHIRVSDLQVSYDIIKSTASKQTVFKNINVYAYLNNINLFLYRADKDDWDPDTPGRVSAPLSVSFGARFSL